MSDAIDDLDLGDALDQLDLEPKPVPPAAPKVAPPTAPSSAATPQPQPKKEKPMASPAAEPKCKTPNCDRPVVFKAIGLCKPCYQKRWSVQKLGEPKKCACGEVIRRDNESGKCKACKGHPAAPAKPAPKPSQVPAPPPPAAQFGAALESFAGHLPPVEQLPMGYALAVHTYVSAAIQKFTTTK